MGRRGLLLLTMLALLAGCGTARGVAHAPAPRPSGVGASGPAAPGAVPAAAAAALRDGNARFAGRILALVARDQPTVALSPYSISEALSMAYAGARGTTAAQMAAALDFRLPEPRLAEAWGALGRSLRGVNGPEATLDIADALYGQQGAAFRAGFLDILARDYGAGMRTVDFRTAPAAARGAINAWVSAHTAGKIPQLLGPQDVNAVTKLVLVNAVYLHAKWVSPFNPQDTTQAPFHAPGGTLNVPTMHADATYGYVRRTGYQALELPYQGGRLAFDVLLPSGPGLAPLLRRLAATGPLPLLRGLNQQPVQLALPKFRSSVRFELAGALSTLGMPLAFEPLVADLSGIAGAPGELYIKSAVHQAYLSVNENGTQAAAATGVGISPTAIKAPQGVQFVVDRPFAFVLRDVKTGAVLFAGVVSDP